MSPSVWMPHVVTPATLLPSDANVFMESATTRSSRTRAGGGTGPPTAAAAAAEAKVGDGCIQSPISKQWKIMI